MRLNKLFLLLLLTPVLPCRVRGQGLYLNAGVHLVAGGAPNLVLNNAGIVSYGQFAADSSTVLFTDDGPAFNSFVDGDLPMSFCNLMIRKSSGVVRLNNDMAVTGTISMEEGNLELNRHMLDLGVSGNISGERNEACITGLDGGTIRKTALLVAPRAVNPGNIGVEFTSDADLGWTTIIRGHDRSMNAGGMTGIQRWFDIAPGSSTNAAVHVRFFYLENELAGEDKSALTLLSATGNSDTWSVWGKDASDPVGNWVLKGGLLSGHRITLATAPDQLSSNLSNSALSVSVYPNPVHDAFSMQIISQKEGNGIFKLYDLSGHVLEVQKVYWQTGMTRVDWDISKYAAGTYYLSTGQQNFVTLNVTKQ